MARAARTRPLNRLRVLLDGGLTVANALDRACSAHPDNPLFHLDNPLPYSRLPGPQITPRQLLAFVNRVGNVLRAAAMQRGDRVAIFKTNAPDYFFLTLAIIKAGGVAVPVNPGMSRPSLRYHLERTASNILVTDSALFSTAIRDAAALPTVHTWVFPNTPARFPARSVALNDAVEQVSEDLTPVPLGPDAEVLIAHTSGTTGRPKSVVSTSGSLICGAKGHYKDEPITTRNRTAVAGHFNHLVYHVGFYSSLLGNLPVWTITRLDADHILRMLERERINIFFAFPDVYFRLYHHGLHNHDLDAMRIWVTTADASHEVHMQEFCAKGAYLRCFGRPLLSSLFIEALGASEIGFAAVRRIRLPFSPLRSDRVVGRRSPAAPRVKVADADGRRLPHNTVGRLMVKGPTLFKGYWRDGAEVVADVDEDGWWWTGDIVYQDWLGRIHHLDRAADVIRTLDGPLYTLPMEELLLRHPQVSDATVVGLPHSRGGQVPVAFVIARLGVAVDPNTCQAWANARLSPPAALHEVLVIHADELPRGLTGKVLKRVLRERHATRYANAGT